MVPVPADVRTHSPCRPRAPLPIWVGCCLVVCFPTIAGRAGAAEPIRLHPKNPHYFLFRGRPAVLITSAEHYGAVLNRDFDYVRYLDTLKTYGFNLTRVFSGTYRELPDSFRIRGNPLAPAPGRYLVPWARATGGDRFDLTRWDQAYFARLKDFVAEAGKRGVVVEVVLFCTMYNDPLWRASPMQADNNINGVGRVGRGDVYGAADPGLLAVQETVTREIVAALAEFDNVYFEICNEPYERAGLTPRWTDRIAAAIAAVEVDRPAKHLIAQNVGQGPVKAADVNPRASVLNFHSATGDSVRLNYALNRVIAADETGGDDQSDRKYRTDGWDVILAGGGVYDHLDFSFTPGGEDGTAVPLSRDTPGGGGPALREQLRVLKEFIEAFDFVKMAPHDGVIKGVQVRVPLAGKPPEARVKVRILAEVGQAYAVHVNGGTHADVVLALPAGTYRAEWVNTKTGRVERDETLTHEGGDRTLASPDYSEDIALRVRRVSGGGK